MDDKRNSEGGEELTKLKRIKTQHTSSSSSSDSVADLPHHVYAHVLQFLVGEPSKTDDINDTLSNWVSLRTVCKTIKQMADDMIMHNHRDGIIQLISEEWVPGHNTRPIVCFLDLGLTLDDFEDNPLLENIIESIEWGGDNQPFACIITHPTVLSEESKPSYILDLAADIGDATLIKQLIDDDRITKDDVGGTGNIWLGAAERNDDVFFTIMAFKDLRNDFLDNMLFSRREEEGLPTIRSLLEDDRVQPPFNPNTALVEASVAGHSWLVKFLLPNVKIDADHVNLAYQKAVEGGKTDVINELKQDPRVVASSV
eukprot:TRINITY_DN8305_c0_g1_i2.p1 TRINITY_DN8305_c0_g1~~TRINITY_DN8305_c0_g1_i2.p1  ORF type:complete len:313 (+),score=71.11 TRINITY_DN8305_c0_g1_i2:16-954(+)